MSLLRCLAYTYAKYFIIIHTAGIFFLCGQWGHLQITWGGRAIGYYYVTSVPQSTVYLATWSLLNRIKFGMKA